MSCSNSFKSVAATALTVVTLLAASGAQASLFTRLNSKAVYDDVAKLTWLQDANANGVMNWADAKTWAAGLSIEGVSGWRLPGGTMVDDYNQTASEMGNMFYTVLGGSADQDITTTHTNVTNYAFFQNIPSTINAFWSGVGVDDTYAWLFNFSNGTQFPYYKTTDLFAWAVRSGDVPEPGALALLGAGLLGWVGVKRSRRAGESIGA